LKINRVFKISKLEMVLSYLITILLKPSADV
jgi:hypothetical protein